MQSTILATKLYIPTGRSTWVSRPRLLQKLTGGWQSGCKVGLISAPAGFGKTTLAAGWLHSLASLSLPPKTAWLSLDASDNDLEIFLRYLVAALQTRVENIGETTIQRMGQIPLPPVESLLLPLLNDLSAFPGRLILVLDDYHVIQQPVIHEAVAFLIERLPASIQVLITTRQDPLLPLSRWRARGLLTDIRLRELRFTEEEAAEFLRHSIGYELSAQDIAALEERTEGWIAGLQLAAISLMQSGPECEAGLVSEFVHSFTGTDRYVMDYLIDEVLCRQPESIQQFLLITSVLERFCVGLCEAVIGEQDNQSAGLGLQTPADVLSYLDQANLFLVALDNRREWYRYHHLFSELLQHRMRISQGKQAAAGIQRKASLWCDENGFPEEAIRYAQAAGNWDLSSRLILKYGVDRLQQGEMTTMLRWLSGLPEEVVRADRALCRLFGYVLTITGKLDRGENYLQLAERDFPGDPEHLGSTLAFASYLACFQGDFQKEIDLAKRAMTLIPQENHWMRGIAAVSLGLGLCHIGDPRGCEEAMREAFAAGQRANTIRTCVHSLTYLGRMCVLRAEFSQAESYFRQASQYQVGGQPYIGIDIPILDLAQLKFEQNNLDQALDLANQAMEINLRSGSIEMRAYAYRLAARIHQLQGRAEDAREYLSKALQLANHSTLSPLTLSLNAACEVEMALAEGSLPVAEQATWRVTNSLGLYSFNFYPEMARVKYWLARGNKTEAAALIDPAVRRAEQPGWEFARLQVRVLQALADPDSVRARQYLAEALRLAEPARVMRCFIDLGVSMQVMIQDLLPQLPPGSSAFAEHLLSAFRSEVLPLLDISRTLAENQAERIGQPVQAGFKQANAGLIEPLTGRELEVLQMLAAGLSNAEIAQQLYLSVNTMKAHTQNIYSKLDAHSRVQAVNKARELGLIQ